MSKVTLSPQYFIIIFMFSLISWDYSLPSSYVVVAVMRSRVKATFFCRLGLCWFVHLLCWTSLGNASTTVLHVDMSGRHKQLLLNSTNPEAYLTRICRFYIILCSENPRGKWPTRTRNFMDNLKCLDMKCFSVNFSLLLEGLEANHEEVASRLHNILQVIHIYLLNMMIRFVQHFCATDSHPVPVTTFIHICPAQLLRYCPFYIKITSILCLKLPTEDENMCVRQVWSAIDT